MLIFRSEQCLFFSSHSFHSTHAKWLSLCYRWHRYLTHRVRERKEMSMKNWKPSMAFAPAHCFFQNTVGMGRSVLKGLKKLPPANSTGCPQSRSCQYLEKPKQREMDLWVSRVSTVHSAAKTGQALKSFHIPYSLEVLPCVTKPLETRKIMIFFSQAFSVLVTFTEGLPKENSVCPYEVASLASTLYCDHWEGCCYCSRRVCKWDGNVLIWPCPQHLWNLGNSTGGGRIIIMSDI